MTFIDIDIRKDSFGAAYPLGNVYRAKIFKNDSNKFHDFYPKSRFKQLTLCNGSDR